MNPSSSWFGPHCARCSSLSRSLLDSGHATSASPAHPSCQEDGTRTVLPAVADLQIGAAISVTVSVAPNENCRCYPYRMTLDQGEPLFETGSPPTPQVGPPAGNPTTYELQALSEGNTVFHGADIR